MLESAYKIKSYTETYDFEDFKSDDKTIDAVIRNLEIIGEASNRIDPDFQSENSEIPWNHLRGLRNRIVHEYFGVDLVIIWTIIEDQLDEMIDWIETILKK